MSDTTLARLGKSCIQQVMNTPGCELWEHVPQKRRRKKRWD